MIIKRHESRIPRAVAAIGIIICLIASIMMSMKIGGNEGLGMFFLVTGAFVFLFYPLQGNILDVTNSGLTCKRESMRHHSHPPVTVFSIQYEEITKIIVRQNAFQRFLKIGTIEIRIKTSLPPLHILNMNNPAALAAEIRTSMKWYANACEDPNYPDDPPKIDNSDTESTGWIGLP